MRLTATQLRDFQHILERIDTGKAEPAFSGPVGLFLRDYMTGRALVERVLAEMSVSIKQDAWANGASVGRAVLHPIAAPIVSVNDSPVGEVASVLAFSDELGATMRLALWLKAGAASDAFNNFREGASAQLDGEYRWTPPSRLTTGEAVVSAQAAVGWEQSRSLKAVGEDLPRPPHALEYIIDYDLGPPGLKYFRSFCVVKKGAAWRAVTATSNPRIVRLVNPPDTRGVAEGAGLMLLAYREPWSNDWTVVRHIEVSGSDVFAHLVTWADYRGELDGSPITGEFVRGLREHAETLGMTVQGDLGANLGRTLLPTALHLARSLQGIRV